MLFSMPFIKTEKDRIKKIKSFINKNYRWKHQKDEADMKSSSIDSFGLVWFGLVEFYGISILVSYLMPNPVYTYVRVCLCVCVIC